MLQSTYSTFAAGEIRCIPPQFTSICEPKYERRSIALPLASSSGPSQTTTCEAHSNNWPIMATCGPFSMLLDWSIQIASIHMIRSWSG